jgi:hypothetical protein
MPAAKVCLDFATAAISAALSLSAPKVEQAMVRERIRVEVRDFISTPGVSGEGLAEKPR